MEAVEVLESKRKRGRPPAFKPERFRDLPCVAKLLWFYIRDQGEGRYSIRELAESLDLTTAAVQRNLKALVERGLLEVLEPPAGSRPGTYRAAPGGEGGA